MIVRVQAPGGLSIYIGYIATALCDHASGLGHGLADGAAVAPWATLRSSSTVQITFWRIMLASVLMGVLLWNTTCCWSVRARKYGDNPLQRFEDLAVIDVGIAGYFVVLAACRTPRVFRIQGRDAPWLGASHKTRSATALVRQNIICRRGPCP
jgi:putative peptidoglycan lipid II flippase